MAVLNKERIQLAHGSGGKLSHDLINQVIFPAFSNDILAEMHDGATLSIAGASLAFTTDSYVVKPRFFAGGDIGKLAVCGTINDLAMTGAIPLYLSVGLILEEGFPLSDLSRILASMRLAAAEAGVLIVTGDTKVVEKGAVDGIYINTAGIGSIITGTKLSPARVQAGQAIILSGFIGDHAIAVMTDRHGLVLPQTIASDCAPLNKLVKTILTEFPHIAMLRDPTRGGVATTLNEIASQAGVGILVEESAIPVRPEVAAVCDMLGFDPLYLANEGKLLLFAEAQEISQILALMKQQPYGHDAQIIGKVTADHAGQVGLYTTIGGIRLLDMLIDDQLPRIC
jgi:hydrogenase expression/formation protein HypE